MKNIHILFIDWGLSSDVIEKALSEELNIDVFNFSNSLRKEIHSHNQLGKEIGNFLERGEILSKEITQKFISKNIKEKTGDFILTSYPRLTEQFLDFQETIQHENAILNTIWYFKLKDQKEFMKRYFEDPNHQIYLEKYGQEIIDNWITRFEVKRKNFKNIKFANYKVEWKEIEIDYKSNLNIEFIKKYIKAFN